jgi:hypothetical protein
MQLLSGYQLHSSIALQMRRAIAYATFRLLCHSPQYPIDPDSLYRTGRQLLQFLTADQPVDAPTPPGRRIEHSLREWSREAEICAPAANVY